MLSFKLITANLEHQDSLYAELATVLEAQQTALVGRDDAALVDANHRQQLLVNALAAVEAERTGLVGGGKRFHLSEWAAQCQDPELRSRLNALAVTLRARVRRVLNLTQTNRLLASDGLTHCRHLLNLLGLEEETGYAPRMQQAERVPVASLRLDVRA
ncbi:MAG TPA: flagellar export chaperone FlgN [Armatimonadota bacterium]|nr:flagellar export chaperone FlgN [Armatimonadota bacterium]